jgi:uncharacterized membrane protein
MNEKLQIVLITVAVFLAGILTGVWTQRTPPVPAPPMPVMGEFAAVHGHRMYPWLWYEGGPAEGLSPQEMQLRLLAIRPRLEAFRHKVRVIEQDFRSNFEQILTSEQKATLLDMIAHRPKPRPAPLLPGCAGEIGHPFVSMIIYRPVLDRLTIKLNLSEAQRSKLRALLLERRKRLLDLLDTTPPPSFELGALVAQPRPEAGNSNTTRLTPPNPQPTPSY